MEIDKKEQLALLKSLSRTDVSRCIQCGRCSASCPAGGKMDLLPSRMVWELAQGNMEALLAARAPWYCLSCLACEERCPRGVSPAQVMEAVRLTHIRPAGANRIAAEELERFPEEMPQQALVAAFRKYNK